MDLSATSPVQEISHPSTIGGDPTKFLAQQQPAVPVVTDPRILQLIAQTARDLLLSLPPPLSGWTKFRLHEHVYNFLVTHPLPDLPVLRKEVYQSTWEMLRTQFNALKGVNDGSMDPFVFKALHDLHSAFASQGLKQDLLADEPVREWNCHKWLFPQHVAFSLLPKTSLVQTPHALNALFEPTSQLDDNFASAALFIANCPLPSHMAELWGSTGTHLCADGGANRLYDWARLPPQNQFVDSYIPKYVIGDLDSVRPEVVKFFKSKGAQILHMQNQDNTDLEKTLNFFSQMKQYSGTTHFVLTGTTGGNLSQELANYHACWSHMDRQIIFASDLGLALFLAPGKHIISAPVGLKCGIIPLGEPCLSISTTGLKWNLNNAVLQFGSLISSSNVTVQPQVQLQNANPVIWTFDVAPPNF